MTDNIPNAASTADLQKLLDQAENEIKYNGMNFSELMNFLYEREIDWSNFGQDALTVHKAAILFQLARLRKYHELRSEQAEANGDKSAQYWKQDADALQDTINRLRGVSMGDRDQCFEEYVSPRDEYLRGLSDESLEVLQHFGAEAPALLNKYSTALEDALIEQVQRSNALATQLKELTGKDFSNEELSEAALKTLEQLKVSHNK
jgi:hypothetical protein